MIVVRATTATAPATRRRVVEASPVVGTLPLLVILETSLGLTEVLSPRVAAETLAAIELTATLAVARAARIFFFLTSFIILFTVQ